MGGAPVDPAVVPRWEWRAFGESFGEAETRLAPLAPTRVEDSDELYMLSPTFTASVKIRAGRLDVKRLEEVSEDGLERWRPVSKLDFPLSSSAVVSLLEALDVAVPPLPRESYGREQLVAEVVDAHDDLLAVPVSKHRARYLIDGCMAELTDVRSGSRTTRTVAAENEDPASSTRRWRRSGSGRGPTSAFRADSPCWSASVPGDTRPSTWGRTR